MDKEFAIILLGCVILAGPAAAGISLLLSAVLK